MKKKTTSEAERQEIQQSLKEKLRRAKSKINVVTKMKKDMDPDELKRQKEMERRKELKKINWHREQWNQTVMSQNK